MSKTPGKVGKPSDSAAGVSTPTPSPLAAAVPAAASVPAAPAPRLDEGEIEKGLAGTPEWTSLADTIQRTFQFRSFPEALGFVHQVAAVAEADAHHPDILIRYNKVTLTLSTHDSGGVTEKDLDAARKYDALVGKKG